MGALPVAEGRGGELDSRGEGMARLPEVVQPPRGLSTSLGRLPGSTCTQGCGRLQAAAGRGLGRARWDASLTVVICGPEDALFPSCVQAAELGRQRAVAV